MNVLIDNKWIMEIIVKISFLFTLAFSYSGMISCQQLQKKVSDPEQVKPVFTEGELTFSNNPDPRSVTDRLSLLTKLPVEVNECSGLEYINGEFWTLNDSGSPASIYKVSSKEDKLLHVLPIVKAENTDWEELAANEEYMYVGNFGNNYGMRKNLKIYSISMEGVNEESESVNLSSTIEFEFADQTVFRHTDNKHNFDCEAMVAIENKLYLFSKNRGDNQCTIYSLDPTIAEKQKAEPISTFNTKGQVTAADYNEDTGVLALLGYVYKPADASMHPFLYLFYDFPDNNFFGGRHLHIDLGIQEQAEGLTFVDENTLYIGCEAESGGQGDLYQFDISGMLE